jgi:hypothetical protein
MPSINWTQHVDDALTHLQRLGRVLRPEAFREIIDDVVMGELTAAQIAASPRTRDLVMTALGHVTTATQEGGGKVLPLGTGWYAFKGDDQPFDVTPGFAAAWKKARGLL